MTRFAGLIMGGLQELTNGWIRPTDKWLNQKNLRRLDWNKCRMTGQVNLTNYWNRKTDEPLNQKTLRMTVLEKKRRMGGLDEPMNDWTRITGRMDILEKLTNGWTRKKN